MKTIERSGAFAGNWIIDHVKVIDTYPQQDTRANTREAWGGIVSPFRGDFASLVRPFPSATRERGPGTEDKSTGGAGILPIDTERTGW